MTSNHLFIDGQNENEFNVSTISLASNITGLENAETILATLGRHLFHMSATMTLFEGVVAIVSSCLIMFGGVVPYMPQYRIIYKTRNANGFSPFVCLTILIANILRILFWFGHKYELPILIQSTIMILTMLIMLELCVRIRTEQEIEMGLGDSEIKKLMDFKIRNFWDWDHFSSYLQFILIFISIGGISTQLLKNVPAFIETIGFLSVFIEAMLPAPQLYRNFVNKSTEGMSLIMVSMWTSGDTFKCVYYILRKSPIQFWICGLLQVSLDLGILIQVCFYYSKNRMLRSTYEIVE